MALCEGSDPFTQGQEGRCQPCAPAPDCGPDSTLVGDVKGCGGKCIRKVTSTETMHTAYNYWDH